MSRKLASIAIETDMVPDMTSPMAWGDFGARSVDSLCRMPFMWEVGSQLHEGGALRLTGDATGWELAVADGLQWSAGHEVNAAEVHQSFLEAAAAAPLVNKLLIACGAAIRVVDNSRLAVTAARFHSVIPAMLSSSIFKLARWVDNRKEHFGLFEVDASIKSKLGATVGARLKRSRMQSALSIEMPDEVILLTTSTPEVGAALFDQKSISMTCQTTFNRALYARYQSNAALRSEPLLLCGELRADPDTRRGADLRLLDRAIDRQALAAEFKGLIEPVMDPMQLWADWRPQNYDSDGARYAARRSGICGQSIRLFYARYSPNAEFCHALARQLKEALSLKIECIPVSFPEYLRRYAAPGEDLVYGLTSPLYDHPSAVLLANLRADCNASEVAEMLSKSMDCSTAADSLSQRSALTLHRVVGNYLTRTHSLRYTKLGQMAFQL